MERKRLLAVFSLLLVTLLFFGFIRQGTASSQNYKNTIDGYCLEVPEAWLSKDILTSVSTQFFDEHISLTIYAQPCETAEDKLVYVGYSNRFLENQQDFTVTGQETILIGDYSTTLSRWSRRPLSRVKQDKYNYACFDIYAGTAYIYTLFFKYDDAVDYETEILPIAKSFRLYGSPGTPYVERLGTTASTSHLDEGAQAAYATLFAEDAPLTWGLFSNYTVYEPPVVAAIADQLDYQFSVYLLYSHFTDTPILNGTTVYNALCTASPDKQIPELTLQTVDDQKGNMLLRTLDGEFDDFLHAYAREVAEYQKPVLFRLANEMNGDWCVYCAFHYCRDPELFVEFYRYVFDIFQQEEATNAIWVWNPNHRSFPNFKWNHERMYYPGDDYVDVIGLTAYNTGNYYEGEVWNTFDELYGDLYAQASETYTQPLMITEFASSSVGGDKVQWIEDMFASIENYPKIKIAVWWNGCDMDNTGDEPVPARPYFMNETEETTAAFYRGLHGRGKNEGES